jgi:hypothetical protein
MYRHNRIFTQVRKLKAIKKGKNTREGCVAEVLGRHFEQFLFLQLFAVLLERIFNKMSQYLLHPASELTNTKHILTARKRKVQELTSHKPFLIHDHVLR